MTAQLDSFETALLARLRARVEGDAPATPPRWSPRWSRRRVVLAGAATVAAAAVMVVVVPGIGTTPAYSVTQGNSGAITVEVRRLEDAPYSRPSWPSSASPPTSPMCPEARSARRGGIRLWAGASPA